MNRREYIQQSTRFLGYALVSGTVIDLMLSCEQKGNLPWTPTFFSKTEASTLSAITNTICPATKTPGANDIGVPQFIDALAKNLLGKKEQLFYKNGIAEINANANKQYGKDFELCDTNQKEQILLALDKSSATTAMTMWGKPMEENPAPLSFYRKIKNLTLMAYFTSEKIGKNYLAYDPIPGKFEGCIPYHNQPNWTES
jgi:hypothetical protein